jgi:hypothetical protein
MKVLGDCKTGTNPFAMDLKRNFQGKHYKNHQNYSYFPSSMDQDRNQDIIAEVSKEELKVVVD